MDHSVNSLSGKKVIYHLLTIFFRRKKGIQKELCKANTTEALIHQD